MGMMWENAKEKFDSLTVEEQQTLELINTLTLRRCELGYNQTELAEMINTTQQQISRIEQFKNYPTLETILKIVNALGMKITINKIGDEK